MSWVVAPASELIAPECVLIVAATMSTHSGAINSLAGATTHDIYLPLTKRSVSDPQTLKMGRLFALGWGVVLTLGALLFPQDTKTPVVVVALGIASFTSGGLLGGFFLGIYWRLSLIHISEPTRQAEISYAVFCLKKKKNNI